MLGNCFIVYNNATVLCHRIYVHWRTQQVYYAFIRRMIRATYLLFQTKHFAQYIHSVDFRWQIQIHTDAFALLKCRHCEYLRKKTLNLNEFFRPLICAQTLTFCVIILDCDKRSMGSIVARAALICLRTTAFAGFRIAAIFVVFFLTIYYVSETKQVKFTRTYGTLLINNVNFKCLNDARDTFTYLSLNEMLRANIIVMMDGKFSIEHRSARHFKLYTDAICLLWNTHCVYCKLYKK